MATPWERYGGPANRAIPRVIEGPPDERRAAAAAQAPIELERERVGLERDRVALEAARQGSAGQPPQGYRVSADGNLEFIPGGPADPDTPRNRSTRQLPTVAIDRLTDGTNTAMALERALSNVNDEFSGNTITGGLENSIQRRFNSFGTPGQAQWWQDVEATDNVARNALFGASLTEGEKAAWEATTVTPSMDPAQVRANLTRRRDIANGALRRLARTYHANGYNEDAIRESLGVLQPIMDDQPAAPAAGQSGAVGVGGVPLAHNLPDEPVNPLTPEQQGAYDAFVRANPHATADQLRAFFRDALGLPGNVNADAIVAARDRPGGGVQPGSAAQFGRPDISSMRGPEGGALENVDAFMRGAADVATLGFSDELSAAGDMITSGGTYRENLDRERAVDAYDVQQNFYPRLSGQLAGGFALPMRATALPGMIREGAAFGGAYGLGSGEGEGRLPSALAGAAIGGAVPPILRGIGAAGRATRSALTRAPSVAEEAAARQDIFLPRMDTGGTPTQLANSIVRNTPGIIPMAAAAERSSTSVAAARDRVASEIGTVADTAGAGQAAQRGMRRFLEGSSARSNELHTAANRAVGADTPAQLSNTITALEERTQGMQSNAQLSAMFEDPRLSGYLSALREGGGLSYTDLRRFRSLVGEMIEQPTVAAEGSSTASLRRLYGGLSQDMEATAASISPRALTQTRRAIQYDRGRHARREEIANAILGRDFRGSAEDATRQINRWSQARTGDSRAIGQALRSMPRDEANTVRASLFSRLGMARPNNQDAGGEVFSVNTFMTQWNSLDDRAMSFLVPNRAHREALNDIAEAASAMKQSSRLENMSRTGIAVNAAAIATGLMSSPAATLLAVASSYGAGRFLASPAGAGWLSRATRARTPTAMRAAIGQLGRVASRDPAIAQDALGLQQLLRGAMNDNTVSRAAASPDEGQNNN